MAASIKEDQRSATIGTPNLRSVVFNLPNQLTWLRLAISVVLFSLLAFGLERGHDRAVYLSAIVLFAVAAGTDWLDGYLARRYGMITTLGRILDPFADKVVVCGTFIFLATIPGSGVKAWMAVIVVGRELLVTALRSFLEQQGADFSATMAGKLKMVLQCAAVIASLVCLMSQVGSIGGLSEWMAWTRGGLVWSAVALTIASGVAYVRTAIQLLRG